MKKLSFILLFLAAFLNANAQLENSLLWEIKNAENGEKSYLFGTYHILGSDYLKDHQKVNKAYQNAQLVVVETVVDSSKMMEVMMLGMMPGKSLKAMVDSADYALLKQKIQAATGMDVAMLDQFKPLTIATLYSLKLAEAADDNGLDYGGTPIDLYFATDGKKQGKQVRPLETMMEQAEILYGSVTMEEQLQWLLEMIKDEESAELSTQKVIQAYLNEDLNTMLAESEDMEAEYGSLDFLLKNRNEKWIASLKPILTKGNAFIAVGALHLPGDDGLIKLLRKEGYHIAPVK